MTELGSWFDYLTARSYFYIFLWVCYLLRKIQSQTNLKTIFLFKTTFENGSLLVPHKARENTEKHSSLTTPILHDSDIPVLYENGQHSNAA